MDDTDVIFVQMDDPFAEIEPEYSTTNSKQKVARGVKKIKLEPELIITEEDRELEIQTVEAKSKLLAKKKESVLSKTKVKVEKINETKSIEPEISEIPKTKVQIKQEENTTNQQIIANTENVCNIEKERSLSPLVETTMKTELESDSDSDYYGINNYEPMSDSDSTEKKVTRTYTKKKKLTRKNYNKPPDENLECCFCGEIFPQLSLLKKHTLNYHEDEEKFECDICAQKFVQHLFIERHMINHTVEEPYCRFCGKTFYSLFTMKRHMNDMHVAPKIYQCEICKKVIESAAKLKKHVKSHFTPKAFPCDICGKPFQSAYLMRYHKIIHTGQKTFKCDVCDKSFTQLPTLRRHKFLHISDSEKTFFCDVCAKKFPAAYLLKSHMQVHEAPSKCPYCEKSFLLPSGLNLHIKAAHSGENPNKCKICSKTFSQPSTLGRHMNLHNTSTEYKCDDCGKKFFVFYYLKKHIHNVHSKAFSCHVCKKSFNKPQKLARHIEIGHNDTGPKIHRKEMRECYICAKAFDQNGLQRHIKRCKRNLDGQPKKASVKIKVEKPPIESNTQPPQFNQFNGIPLDFTTDIKPKTFNKYKCTVCDLTLSQSSTLTRHMKIHAREIHKCNYCAKDFHRVDHLEKHYNDVHDFTKPHKCDVCKKTFSHLVTLNSHITIHGIKEPFELNSV